MGRTVKYGIGLDIGTNSIGFSAVNEQGQLIRLKGKKVYGVYLYHEGQPAADRRVFRTTRRRIKRARRRSNLLKTFFAPHISKVDPEFFDRLKTSSISPQDKHHTKFGEGLFADQSDEDFYRKYPTIYHLRYALMTEQRQFDVREVFLAIHHMMKHRGNFLTVGPARNFDPMQIDLKSLFYMLQDTYATLIPDVALSFDQIDVESFKKVIFDRTRSRSDRKRAIVSQLLENNQTADKDLAKLVKQIITEIANGMLNLNTKVDVLVQRESGADTSWKKTFDTIDDFVEEKDSELSDEAHVIIETIQTFYRSIVLTEIMPDGTGFSEHKVALYTKHCKDLKKFKQYLATLPDVTTKREVRAIYSNYIDGPSGKAVTVTDDFYAELKKVFKKYPHALADEMLADIDANNFMPKLRTKENGAVPNQVHQREMDKVIENQARYYPWLVTSNPVVSHRKDNPYKLDELLTFRLPYYNGPAITAEDQQAQSGANFAWMIRKAPGEITPWNYDEKVDRHQTADAFIRRMKTTDTYLLGEDVVPKQSLLYQRFEVLNELNMTRVNGHSLTRDQKQGVYNEIFKRNKTVRFSKVQDNLIAHGEFSTRPELSGLAGETSFLSNLSTYNDLHPILGEALDDPSRYADIEQIIEWATIFEDAEIRAEKLQTITWLNEEQVQRLSKKRYRGWGQFSRRFLTGLKLENGHTIIEELWEKQTNLMHILSDDRLKKAVDEYNKKELDPNHDLDPERVDELLDAAYTSPTNKKAIRKVLKLIKDIQDANGGIAPTWLFLETADGTGKPGSRTRSRASQIEDAYKRAANEITASMQEELKNKIKSKADFTDRLFLYFMQNGIDLYTGKQINIDKLSNYDIDHIIPQAITKDDSLNNRVLVDAEANREKGDRLAFEVFGAEMMPTWRRLAAAGLISKGKMANLSMRASELDRRAEGFIARQLVETRQIIKLTEQIVSVFYPDTKIVAVKAGLSHQFREDFDFPKVREVNDYHHAFDALLAAWIGLYLLHRYPRLTPFFVYGDYTKADYKKIRRFNFMAELKTQQATVINDDGEILWGGVSAIDALRHIFEYKQIITVHEMSENRGALYNQTLYAASDADNRKLIPTKSDRPVEIYGGYTSEQVAYLAIAHVADEKKEYFQVMGVPTRMLQTIDELVRSGVNEREALAQILAFRVTSRGKTLPFEVVLPHVHLDQLFYNDENGYFMLGTDTYFHNYQQLWLSKSDQAILAKMNKRLDDVNLGEIDSVLQHAIEQSLRYFKLYRMNKFNATLEQFLMKLSDDRSGDFEVKERKNERKEQLSQLLIGLGANPSFGNLKSLHVSTPFGQLQVPGGIKLDLDTQIIYQSPSGLFERRVALKSLQ